MTKLSSLLTESSKAVMQAKSVQEQLQKVQASSAAGDAAKALEKKVTELLEGGEAANAGPALGDVNEGIYGLYNTVGQVDAAPTPAQVQATDTFATQLPALVQQWQAISTKDLPALNQQLKGAGQPEIEFGKIDHDERVGAAGSGRGRAQPAVGTIESGDAGDRLGAAHRRRRRDVDEELHALRGHASAAHAVEPDARRGPAQRARQRGAVQIAGGLAGDQHDRARPLRRRRHAC